MRFDRLLGRHLDHRHTIEDIVGMDSGFLPLSGGVLSGPLTVSALRIPEGAQAGFVLTSDAEGFVTWQEGGGGGGGGGGDSITVYGQAVVNANLSSVPPPPASGVSVVWQKDSNSPANISAFVPASGVASVLNLNILPGTLSPSKGGTGRTSFSKGETLVGNATGGLSGLGVGANGQVLTADSTQTLGVRWSTPASGLGETFETVSKNLRSYPYTLSYSGGELVAIVYNLGGGQTIVKNLVRVGGVLTQVVLTGSTPTGGTLTKNLSYTDGNLTGVSYS